MDATNIKDLGASIRILADLNTFSQYFVLCEGAKKMELVAVQDEMRHLFLLCVPRSCRDVDPDSKAQDSQTEMK